MYYQSYVIKYYHIRKAICKKKLIYAVFILKLDLIITLFLARFVFTLGTSNLRVRRSECLQA